MLNQKKQTKKTGLYCPITGGELLRLERNRFVLDGPTYYEVAGFPGMKYEKWGRSMFYRNINSGRYFLPIYEDQSWIEYKDFEGIDNLFPIDTPEDEINQERAK